jgi:2-polyprenyl-3-methyl-5-hydroxy-6-metoxy-1,4-benzoquinol methylase
MQQPPTSGNRCLMCGNDQGFVLFRSNDRLYGLTDKTFDVMRCAECGMVRLSPQPPAEELKHYYPDAYWFAPDATMTSGFEQAYRRLVLLDHLTFLKDLNGPLLDVGCGGGLLLTMLRERGVKGVGLDLSQSAVQAASKQGIPVVSASLTEAPFSPGTFRAITMFHVVEHVADPGRYLKAAHALLADGGRLIVQVPNAASWQARLLGKRWIGFDVPRHLHTFRESDLITLVHKYNFKVVRRKHFSLRDNPACLATSIAPMLDPMARRVRGQSAMRLFKDLTYFSLTLGSLPFAALEAGFKRGSTIMIEAIRSA